MVPPAVCQPGGREATPESEAGAGAEVNVELEGTVVGALDDTLAESAGKDDIDSDAEVSDALGGAAGELTVDADAELEGAGVAEADEEEDEEPMIVNSGLALPESPNKTIM